MSISGMGGLARITSARTRSISAENPDGRVGGGGRATRGTGAKAGRDLGKGWKISPSIQLKAGATTTIAEMTGPGVVQHIWITVHPSQWRNIVLRCYWDGAATPAVATPLGDFFGQGWCEFAQLSSLPIATNAHGGLNSYWEMPFRKSARITLQNVGAEETTVYYQVTYSLQDVPDDTAYLHATWRRSNPLPYMEMHPILDGITGAGHYVGTYLAWGSNNKGWWGEGEIKFYLDGDAEYPTICGTGTEDYVGGAWCFQGPGTGYQTYTTPYLGFHQAIKPDGVHHSQTRFGMYRWHVADPVRFAKDLRVDIQALGWRSGGRYLPLQDDIASTAFWYQDVAGGTGHTATLDADTMEVI